MEEYQDLTDSELGNPMKDTLLTEKEPAKNDYLFIPIPG